MEEMKAILNAILENQQVTNAKLTALTLDVRNLQGEMQRTHERLDKIETRLDRVEARLEKVEERLDRVEARLDKVEERLDGVEARLDKVEERLDGISESVQFLVHKTGEHDKEIYVLKRKQNG